MNLLQVVQDQFEAVMRGIGEAVRDKRCYFCGKDATSKRLISEDAAPEDAIKVPVCIEHGEKE